MPWPPLLVSWRAASAVCCSRLWWHASGLLRSTLARGVLLSLVARMNDAAMRCPRPGTGGSGNGPHASWGMSLPGLPGILYLVSVKLHHRCRRLCQAQRRSWCRQRLHRRCGLRGVRVGGARNPGPTHDASARPRSPADADRPSHRRRVSAASSHNLVFCPVAGCCKGDPERSSGWSSHQGLRHHLDDHCSGVYSGAIPQQYLDEHGLDLCSVCGLTVKLQFNGCHPRCRPTAFGGLMGSAAACGRSFVPAGRPQPVRRSRLATHAASALRLRVTSPVPALPLLPRLP